LVKVLPAIFSYEDMKSKWNQDNPNNLYSRRDELQQGIYALDKWLIRVDDNDRTIATIGWKEYPSHTVVGGLLATHRANPRRPEFEEGLGKNERALQSAREPQMNQSKPLVAAFGAREGSPEAWIQRGRSRGWIFSKDENFDQVKNLLPEAVINEWNTAYPKGNWAIRPITDAESLAKWIFIDDEMPEWWNIVKAKPNSMKAISDSQWLTLKERILNDEVPVDRTKYVKYTNLSGINRRMVLYYLKLGFSRPRRRAEAYRGILEEMLRSSNERYDIEDGN
tara:strand:+ start:913 stop:1752 length:840 start_codon:yes stop_codon:yes gene_type:complete